MLYIRACQLFSSASQNRLKPSLQQRLQLAQHKNNLMIAIKLYEISSKAIFCVRDPYLNRDLWFEKRSFTPTTNDCFLSPQSL